MSRKKTPFYIFLQSGAKVYKFKKTYYSHKRTNKVKLDINGKVFIGIKREVKGEFKIDVPMNKKWVEDLYFLIGLGIPILPN